MAKKLVIKYKDNEIIYPKTLSNLVLNEITGNTVKEDLENVGSKLLLLSETDGTANKTTLNAALAQGDVKLKKGHYPIDPTITINNVVLDLNGSCLQSTQEKHEGYLIMLKGKNPVIRNGEVCGNYNTADNEPGYVSFEKERLIGAKVYDNALIENLDIHNCWGYAIVGPNPNWGSEEGVMKSPTSATLVTDKYEEGNIYLSKAVDVPSGYAYAAIYGGIGTSGKIISRRDVIYKFYDSNNNLIKSITKTPRLSVPVPEGASTLRVESLTFGDWDRANIGFFNCTYDCLTVRNCSIHNNHSLGMVGMGFGVTRIESCISYENGKPRTTASLPTDRSTTGFIDVEENPCPLIIMDGCISRDEKALALIGAYKLIMNNCVGTITVYDGWSANITNCVGYISAITNGTETLINVSNCTFYKTPRTSVNWIGMNNTFIGCKPDDSTKENNFIIQMISSTIPEISLVGIIRGKIVNRHNTSTDHKLADVNLLKGSSLIFDRQPLTTSATPKTAKICRISGDCYGIVSNYPFYPNGHTIYDSTFTLSYTVGASAINNIAWTGEFNNCVFNLDGGSMFYGVNNNLSQNGKTLVFRNCKINNVNNYLFLTNMPNLEGKGYSIKFINCTIADTTKLFAVTPTDFTYEIITEDLDYDSRIKVLEERISALETNGNSN